jgi:hypothetical protein
MKSCHTLIHSGCGGIIANKEIQFALRGFCVTFCTAPRRAAHSEFYNWSDLFWEQESGEKEIRFFHFKSSVFLFV